MAQKCVAVSLITYTQIRVLTDENLVSCNYTKFSQLKMKKNKGKTHIDLPADDEVISKTQKKQMVHDLQDLARQIVAMPAKKRSQLDLPEVFVNAIDESKRINSHIARKRHFQYMGKLLLKMDHEAIIERIEQVENIDGHYQIRDEVINLWIEHLAAHETVLLNHLYQHHEQDVLAQLRQAWRNHQKKPEHPAPRKKLFQTLRSMDKVTELPNPLTLI